MTDFEYTEEEIGDEFVLPVDASAGASWIANMAMRLHRYETAPTSGRENMRTFESLRDSFPELEFPLRLEPREIFVDALARSWSINPGQLTAALSHFIMAKAPELELGSVETGLSVLADSSVVLSEGDLFAAQSLLANWPGDVSVEGGYRSLLLLAKPGNWRAIVSLLERILADGAVHSRSIQAGLESVAKYAPSQLGAVIFRVSDALERLTPRVLNHLVKQLASRATPYICALALLELDPLQSPKLAAAALDGNPFGLQCNPVEDEEDQLVVINDGVRPLLLSDDRTGQDVQVWIALATTAIRAVEKSTGVRVILTDGFGLPTLTKRESMIHSYFSNLAVAAG